MKKSCIAQIFSRPPGEVLKTMMSINIRDAKSIFELAKANGCTDSQEFINWQDELNEISVKYE